MKMKREIDIEKANRQLPGYTGKMPVPGDSFDQAAVFCCFLNLNFCGWSQSDFLLLTPGRRQSQLSASC